MSKIPYRSFVCSKPFVVLGPGKRLFYVHGELLARSSPVLDTDVNGGIQEKRLETIEIKDVDGDIDDDTVLRFIEYAYNGDYTVPDPDVVQLATDSKELEEAFAAGSLQAPEKDEFGWPSSTRKSKKDLKRKIATMFDTYDAPHDDPLVEKIRRIGRNSGTLPTRPPARASKYWHEPKKTVGFVLC